MDKIKATIESIQQETPEVKRFVLKLQEPGFSYFPGQWIDLFCEIDGEHQVGGYSLTSQPLPENSQIELAIKHSAKHPVTAFMHNQAKVGDTVLISQAQGNCIYQPEMGKKVVLIAGGVGITPLMSIFRTVRDQYPDTHIALLYSAKTPEDFVFADEICASAEQHKHILAAFTCTDLEAKLPDWVHFQERIDTFFLKTMNLPQDAQYFICGPSPMLREVEESLLEIKVPAGHIHYEKW